MDKSTEIRTGRHCIFNLHVHLVFVTKYQRHVLASEHILALREIFGKICQSFRAELVEMDGEDDHVHLLITYPPTVSLSKLVNSLKGASSRTMRNRFKNLGKRYYKGALWSPSYFAGSCGGAPISIIKEYIEKQKTPD